MIIKIVQLGHIKTVILISSIAIIGSVLVYIPIGYLMAKEVHFVSILILILIPMILTPTIIWYMVKLLITIELQRKEIKEYTDTINKYVITSTTDLDGIITSISDAGCKISCYIRDELIGKKHSILRHSDTPEEVYRDMWRTITKGKVWSGEFKNRKKDGSSYWVYGIITPQFDDKNNIKYYTSIRQDITDKKMIENLSKRDKLTGLYNRMKLDKSLSCEVASAKRYKTNLSFILLDIDYFKLVNDTYGHLVGDNVLIQIATILKDNIRQSDILGRWGGEEFIIICPNSDINATKQLAEKLRVAIEEFDFDVIKNKTSSFGVSQLKEDDNINSLIKRADDALYKAKRTGRNRVELG